MGQLHGERGERGQLYRAAARGVAERWRLAAPRIQHREQRVGGGRDSGDGWMAELDDSQRAGRARCGAAADDLVVRQRGIQCGIDIRECRVERYAAVDGNIAVRADDVRDERSGRGHGSAHPQLAVDRRHLVRSAVLDLESAGGVHQ